MQYPFIITYTGPPSLKKHQVMSVREKAQNVIANFSLIPTDVTNISWNFVGNTFTLTEPPILVNSTILVFNEVTREHNGTYTLTNMNCQSDKCDNSTGEMILDVQCKWSIQV